MADMQGNDLPRDRWDPRNPDFADLLADALAAQAGDASPAAPDADGGANGAPGGEGDRVLDDALEVLGEPCLEGEQGAAWSARLLADEDLRAHVVDVGLARLSADETRLDPQVRAAALEALEPQAGDLPSLATARDAQARRRTVRTEPVRATGWRPGLRTRAWAAAALLVIGLGAVLYFGALGRTAEAGLQLTSLARVDLAGPVRMSSVEPRYFAALGRVYTPAENELLSFGFGRDALLVVGEGDAVRVARSPLLERIVDDVDEVEDVDTVLRLEAGEARLATRQDPLLLAVDAVGILVLIEGAAHVAFDANDGSGAPAVALVERSVARFYTQDGSHVPLTGPTRVRLAAEGPQAFGEPARSLFRDLEFFGGPLPRAQIVRFVPPRLWRVVSGAVHRSRSDLRLVDSAHDEAASMQVAWSPPAVLAGAETLRVALRAPGGTRVSLPGLDVDAVTTVDASAGEPGTATVDLPLPADWYGRLEGGALQLLVDVPERPEDPAPEAGDRASSTRARLEGASFVVSESIEDALQRAKELSGE